MDMATMQAARSVVGRPTWTGRNRGERKAYRNGVHTCAAFALEPPPYELVRARACVPSERDWITTEEWLTTERTNGWIVGRA